MSHCNQCPRLCLWTKVTQYPCRDRSIDVNNDNSSSSFIMYIIFCVSMNSLWPSYALCQKCLPSLVHVMACRLFGARPLFEPMLTYSQLDYWEQTSGKILKYNNYNSAKYTRKCRLQKCRPFCRFVLQVTMGLLQPPMTLNAWGLPLTTANLMEVIQA